MAIQLDASQYYKVFNLGGILNPTVGYTVATWCRPTFASDANTHAIANWGVSGGVSSFFVGIAGIGINYTFFASNNSANTGFARTSTAATQNDWFLVVAAYQGTGVNLYVYHYTGGTMVGPFAIAASGTGTADADTTSASFFIGALRDTTAKWQGNIFSTTVWLAALTQQEATAMAFGASPRTVRPAHMAISLPFSMYGYNTDSFQNVSPRGSFQQPAQNTSGVGFTTPDVQISNPPFAGLSPFVDDSVRGNFGWDQSLPIISQTARRPFPAPLQGLISMTPNASGVDFRRTLAHQGNRSGSRQTIGYMNG